MKQENQSLDVLPLMKITEVEKNIAESLVKIRSKISKANPLITMIQLYIHKCINLLGNIEASVYGNVKPYENKMLDFTQSLLITTNCDLVGGSLDKDEIKEYLEELEKIFNAAASYVVVAPKDELIKYLKECK
ncbi:hypothetical protein [Mesobacillus boroniphilus]|uniref:hypothetical protein n=1 Tax=Mesobacillus boroniphilus TaxID=308892 RepID=UPI000555C5E5|nr:hypothetical protein [Mesobacillus boroniphilus]